MATDPNTSASGGVLLPTPVPSWDPLPWTADNASPTADNTGPQTADSDLNFPEEDAALDAIFQVTVVAITGLPGFYVRPRWQPENPKQPEPDVNWCAIGVVSESPDAGPAITHLGTDPGADNYVDHEDIDLLATFYGPSAGAYAKRLRDGLGVPQNTEALGAEQIRFIASGSVTTVPDLLNQQWVLRKDLPLHFRRKVTRYYPVENLLSAVEETISDNGIDDTITVPPA
jgi:hypothetical protein